MKINVSSKNFAEPMICFPMHCYSSNQIRTRTLDVHIRRLRIKLGSYSGQYLETIFGIGYRFQPFRTKQRFHSDMPSSALALTA